MQLSAVYHTAQPGGMVNKKPKREPPPKSLTPKLIAPCPGCGACTRLYGSPNCPNCGVVRRDFMPPVYEFKARFATLGYGLVPGCRPAFGAG